MPPQPQVPAFVAVGSNLEVEKHVPAALQKLRARLRIVAVSTFYRTPPLPVAVPPGLSTPAVQPPFLNGVVRVETDLPPRALKFGLLRRIEEELGRVRTADRCAARTIDLDLVLYGNVVLDEPGLRLPDPEVRTRNFIAVPLLELAPELVLPDTGERLADLPIAHNLTGMEVQGEFTRALRVTTAAVTPSPLPSAAPPLPPRSGRAR